MKIAHIADAHLGYRSLPYVNNEIFPIKVNSREFDVYKSLKNVICEILLHTPDVLVISGDLFDSVRPSNLTMRMAASIFKDIEIPILLIPGNHDKSIDGDISPCMLLSFLCPRVTCVDYFVDSIDIGTCTFYLLPTTDSKLDFTLPVTSSSVLIAHAPIGGPEEYRYTSHLLDPAFTDKFTVCLLGDLHKYYKKGNVIYPGSLERLSFNEVNNSGGYVIIDIERDEFKSTFYPWEHYVKMVDIRINSQEELESYREKMEKAIVRITSSAEIDVSSYKDSAYHISFRLQKDDLPDVIQVTGVTLQEMWLNYLKDMGKEHLLEPSLPFWREAVTNKS